MLTDFSQERNTFLSSDWPKRNIINLDLRKGNSIYHPTSQQFNNYLRVDDLSYPLR